MPTPIVGCGYAKTLLRNIKTTPVVVDDTMFISVQSSGIANQWLATADQVETGNNDGKLSKAEMQALLGEVNGKALRKASRLPNSGDDYASPVFGDGKIYVAGENGTVLVLADSPDGPVLAKNDMGDSIVATPASAEGRVLIRTRSKLFCIESNLP